MWNVVIIYKRHVNQGIFVNLERDSMKIRPMTIFFFLNSISKGSSGTHGQHLL
jgi:hypothetical protein